MEFACFRLLKDIVLGAMEDHLKTFSAFKSRISSLAPCRDYFYNLWLTLSKTYKRNLCEKSSFCQAATKLARLLLRKMVSLCKDAQSNKGYRWLDKY